jgi:serine/threonine-protein kinase HipA
MKGANETKIWVYADWAGIETTQLMGILLSQHIRGKEVFSFEYATDWLKTNTRFAYLDPQLGHYAGKQFLSDDHLNFWIHPLIDGGVC